LNEGQIQDKRLLQLIARGDEPAFKTLFEKYRGKLYTYLKGITKSPEVSEEIVIDVFLKSDSAGKPLLKFSISLGFYSE